MPENVMAKLWEIILAAEIIAAFNEEGGAFKKKRGYAQNG
jgi:ribosomal protein S7